MALDPVGTADYQQGVIQYLQGTFHLCGEIHMSGRIQQGNIQSFPGYLCLLGKDRNPPLPLLRKMIKKSVPMIHPAQFPNPPAGI